MEQPGGIRPTGTSPEVLKSVEKKKVLSDRTLGKNIVNVSCFLGWLLVGRDGVPWCPLYSWYKTYTFFSKFTLKPRSAVVVEEGVSN